VFNANFSNISAISWREQILQINIKIYQTLRNKIFVYKTIVLNIYIYSNKRKQFFKKKIKIVSPATFVNIYFFI